MKRNKPLRSKRGLRTVKGLKPGGPLKRGKALQAKPTGVRGALDVQASAAFKAKVTAFGCKVCGPEGRQCAGGTEAHHVLDQQWLKRHVRSLRLPRDEAHAALRSLLWDPRNGLGICTRRHDLHTRGIHRIPRAVVPAKAWQFAGELPGGRERLLRMYPEAG